MKNELHVRSTKSKKAEFIYRVNEHFFDERNAAGGNYGQTLINYYPEKWQDKK